MLQIIYVVASCHIFNTTRLAKKGIFKKEDSSQSSQKTQQCEVYGKLGRNSNDREYLIVVRLLEDKIHILIDIFHALNIFSFQIHIAHLHYAIATTVIKTKKYNDQDNCKMT